MLPQFHEIMAERVIPDLARNLRSAAAEAAGEGADVFAVDDMAADMIHALFEFLGLCDYEVGQALLDIKTKGLYKEYGTFEDYCRQRWDIDRDTAYYLRQSVSIMDNISDPLHEQPLNLEQVKPLNKLKEPQEQREAWQMAVESAANGRITARHVEAAVQAIKQVEQGSQSRRILHSSESNEWYTPRRSRFTTRPPKP